MNIFPPVLNFSYDYTTAKSIIILINYNRNKRASTKRIITAFFHNGAMNETYYDCLIDIVEN